MSSTTSTTYTAQRVRQTGRPLYTIPDEAAGDDSEEDDADGGEGHNGASSSTGQSEDAPTDEVPFSAAAQALHHEADALVTISHHASDTAESFPEMGMDKEAVPSSSKSMGSLGSLSGGLSPVSEARSAGHVASQEASLDDDEEEQKGSVLGHRTASTSEAPAASQSGGHAAFEHQPATRLHSSLPLAEPGSQIEPAELRQDMSRQTSLDSDSLHTPRAMSPPSTPNAPVLPKIDAGPATLPPALQEVHQPSDTPDNSATNGNTMFAGLDMMS